MLNDDEKKILSDWFTGVHERFRPPHPFLGQGEIGPLTPLRKPEREPVPFELLRSRTLIRREAMFDVIERYEPVGGILLLVSVERVPW